MYSARPDFTTMPIGLDKSSRSLGSVGSIVMPSGALQAIWAWRRIARRVRGRSFVDRTGRFFSLHALGILPVVKPSPYAASDRLRQSPRHPINAAGQLAAVYEQIERPVIRPRWQ